MVSQSTKEQAHPVEMPIPFVHQTWFVHHLAMAMNFCHLPNPPVFEYQGSKQNLAEQATLFSLRAIGLTDEAIKRYYNNEQLKILKQSI